MSQSHRAEFILESKKIFWISSINQHGYGKSSRVPLHAKPLQWRHNEHDSVSNHQPHDCLLNRLFGRRSKKTSKLRVTGLCAGNSPGTGEFPAQMASNADNVSIWWHHHAVVSLSCIFNMAGEGMATLKARASTTTVSYPEIFQFKHRES